MLSFAIFLLLVVSAVMTRRAYFAVQKCENDPHWTGIEAARVRLIRLVVGTILVAGWFFSSLSR